MSDTQTWQKRALDLKPQSQIFIDGKYVDAASGKTFENYSPSDGHLICNVASGDSEDINRAVASAKKAFDSGIWSEMNPRDKKAIMLRWAQLLNENREELALLEAIDTGRPISDAMSVDAPNSARVI